MRICIDVRSAVAQRAGVGRYTKLLVQHLGPIAGHDNLRLFYFDFKRKGIRFETSNSSHRAVRWCPGRMAQLAWRTVHWPPFNSFAGEADVYHFPNFILPPLSAGKSVVTIHDMSFLRFPELAEERNRRYLSARIRDTAVRADAIIADSEFSGVEIRELLHVNPDRIFPIHLGVGTEFKAPGPDRVRSVLARFRIDRPYILTVGTLEPRKNITFLVDVFEKLSGFDGYLVVAGMPGWKYEPIIARMRTSSRSSRIRYLEYVSDSQLPALYAGADLFVLTSVYEGFGLPPLESMACGVPVVSSASGSLTEILGEGAVLIDTFNSDLWATCVEKALSDREYREAMITKGYRQASKYTWTETARKTLDLYRSL